MNNPRWPINLDDDGSVVTQYGEVLGAWDEDESGSLYTFIPLGADKVMFISPMMGQLCRWIHEWHSGESAESYRPIE